MNASGSFLAAALAVLLLAGCVTRSGQPDSEEMFIRASMLTKLSAAVESTVRYKNPPPDVSESELLIMATRHDPALLENFKAYKLRVLRQDRHSIVLVCDRAGAQALLEDAGCSGPMDRARWMEKPEPCEFSLDIGALCKVNARPTRPTQGQLKFLIAVARQVRPMGFKPGKPRGACGLHEASRVCIAGPDCRHPPRFNTVSLASGSSSG